MALNGGHGVNEGMGPRQVAHPPAGHGIGLGEPVANQGAIEHALHGRNAQVLGPVVENFFVNFIGHHRNVRFNHHLGDRPNFVGAVNLARGV